MSREAKAMRNATAVGLGLTLLVLATPALAQRGPRGGGRPAPETPAPAPAPAPAPPGGGRTYGFQIPEILAAMDSGEGHEALAFYERTAKDAERRGAGFEAAQAYTAVAYMGMSLGAFQKCIVAGLRAVDLLKKESPSEPVASVTINALLPLGNCYRSVGDFAEARRRFEDGLHAASILPGQGRSLKRGFLSNTIAMTAFQQGDYEDALRSARNAVKDLEDVLTASPPGMSRDMAARIAAGKDGARRHLAKSHFILGITEVARGHPDEAEAAFKEALGYARFGALVDQEAEIRGGFGRVALQRNDVRGATRHFEDAIALARKVERIPLLVVLYEGLARTQAAAGQTDKALGSVRQSIGLIESVRGGLQDAGLRSSFLEDKQGVYRLGVRFALEGQRVEEAFGFAESSRARAFLDLLGNQTTLSKGKTRALVDEEVRLRAQVAAGQAQAGEDGDARRGRSALETAEKAYQAFLERVRRENLEQASLMSVEPVTLKEVQSLLPENTTLLEYLVAEDELIVWVVDRARVSVVRVPARHAELVADVRAFRAGIAAVAPLAELQGRARALYDRLIAPVRARTAGHRLIVVPHDALHYLPFAALRTPEGRWLVEDHAISTLPSASVLKFLQGKGAGAPARTLAVGNPDLGAALALRYAEREARMVGRHLPGSTVLVRDQATEARAKQLAPQAGVVHFALHGDLDEKDPLSSALLLVPDGGEDGRLEVRELFGLELVARLVVLSACETGLGKLSRGDELVGLQRAFLYAGTPAIITTLWKVDDRASYELVEAFYAALGSQDAAEALRAAQRATLKRHAHPFAWAAFGLSGVAN